MVFLFSGTARDSPDPSGPTDAYTGATSNHRLSAGKVSVVQLSLFGVDVAALWSLAAAKRTQFIKPVWVLHKIPPSTYFQLGIL